METTIDLPDALIRAVRLRAVREGRGLNDTMTDLVRIGLAASGDGPDRLAPPAVTTDPKTRLPVIECPHEALPEDEMTPDRVADILESAEAQNIVLAPAQRQLGKLMRGGQ
jgi:plasmid stability protein